MMISDNKRSYRKSFSNNRCCGLYIKIVLIIILLVYVSAQAFSRTLFECAKLSEMITEAKLIVIGKLEPNAGIKGFSLNPDSSGIYYVLSVEEVIYGKSDSNKIKLVYKYFCQPYLLDKNRHEALPNFVQADESYLFFFDSEMPDKDSFYSLIRVEPLGSKYEVISLLRKLYKFQGISKSSEDKNKPVKGY